VQGSVLIPRAVNGDPNTIPGDSPLALCPKEYAHDSVDILQIKSVDILPNPPEAGVTLTIVAEGYAKKTIKEGAYVLLQLKWGLIRLINTKADLCEQIKNVDIECPIEEGKISIQKDIQLPKEIPPGKYTITADVYSVDDEPITCLTAVVVFGKKELGIPFFNVEL